MSNLLKKRNKDDPTTHDFEPIKNPYIVGNPIKSTEMFFGRKDELKKIQDWIVNDGPHVVLLVAGRRSGKTSILWQIRGGRLHQSGEAVLCDFHKMVPKIKQDEDFPFEVGKAILENPKFKPFEADFLREDNTSWTVRLEQLVRNCLNQIKPRKLIILCDEVEAIEALFKSTELSANALLWVKEALNLPVHFVMTSTREFEGSTIRTVLSPATQICPIYELSLLDAVALIQNPVEEDLTYQDEVPDLIYRLSGGHPFYVQYICHTLVNHINAELRRNHVTAKDLDGVIDFIVRNPAGHIQETWKSLSNPSSYAPKYARETLAALANTIKRSKEYVGASKIFKTVRKKKFNIDEPALHKTLAWFVQNTRLLEKQAENYRFRSDLLRYWISYEFQSGDDIDPLIGNFAPPTPMPGHSLSSDKRGGVYAKKLGTFLKDGTITVRARIELDHALTELRLENEQAEAIENQIRETGHLKPIRWEQEYRDSCYFLKEQYSDGIPAHELELLQSTYVSTNRISTSVAKEISQYFLQSHSGLGKRYFWGGIVVAVGVMAIAALVVFFKPALVFKPDPVSPDNPVVSTEPVSDDNEVVPSESASGDNEIVPTEPVSVDNNKIILTARDDTIYTERNTQLLIPVSDLLSNDTSAENDILMITAINNANNGKAILTSDGNVKFVPAEDFIGNAGFNYTVSDGKNTPSAATVMVIVELSLPKMAFLYFNDFHGALEPVVRTKVGQNGKQSEIYGIARMARVVNRIRATNQRHNIPTYLVNAGDFLQGPLLSNASKGNIEVEIFNIMELSFYTIGIHELDFGPDNLLKLTGAIKAPNVTANYQIKNKPVGEPRIFEINGIKMGVAGLIAAQDFSLQMPQVDPAFLKEGGAEDEFKKAAEIVSEFKSKGVDLVVFVTHFGLEADKKLAKEVEGIDIIIGGDSHTAMEGCEIVKNKKNKTCIVQAGAEGQYLGHLKVTLWKGQPGSFHAELTELDEKVTPEPKIARHIQFKRNELKQRYGMTIAYNDCFLEGTKATIRREETNLGDFITDILKDYFSANIAIYNSGGIRASLPEGKVTIGDVMGVLPFPTNQTHILELNGKELLEVLNYNATQVGKGGFLQVSGISFKLSPNTGAHNVEVKGKPVEPDKIYTVVTNSFVATGGDGYDMLDKVSDDRRDYDANPTPILIDYIKEHYGDVGKHISYCQSQDRITIVEQPKY